MTGRHLPAWVALVAVLTAGCGVRPSAVITGVPAPTAQAVNQPDETVAPGMPGGTVLYFLAGTALTPVVRPAPQHLSPTQRLVLLQDGPNRQERAANLTSEVPAGLDPVTVATDVSGNVEVLVSTDVTTLSPRAVDQITCTVRDALSATGSLTLTSGDVTRGPLRCPFAG